MNMDVISQLEELTARFRAYEAICAHLSRERMPLQDHLEKHADLQPRAVQSSTWNQSSIVATPPEL
jgi:hypothetical protein